MSKVHGTERSDRSVPQAGGEGARNRGDLEYAQSNARQ